MNVKETHAEIQMKNVSIPVVVSYAVHQTLINLTALKLKVQVAIRTKNKTIKCFQTVN